MTRSGAAGPFGTPRLLLHRPAEADAERLKALLMLREIRDGLAHGAMPPEADDHDRVRFAATCRSTGALLGMVALKQTWLSYCVDPQAWGQGLGSEMVKAAVEQIGPSRGLTRLDATIDRGNVRSRRLLEAAGFRFSGLTNVARPGSGAAIVALRYQRPLPRPTLHLHKPGGTPNE